MNEVLQILLARYVSTDELVPALVEPIVELRVHRVGPFFIPAFHASVHLNVGTQSIACVAPTGDDWYCAFPSNPLGGKLTERRKFKTDCPSRTVLMGDLNLNGFSASGAWLLISTGAMRFDNSKFTYCAVPELNVFCNAVQLELVCVRTHIGIRRLPAPNRTQGARRAAHQHLPLSRLGETGGGRRVPLTHRRRRLRFGDTGVQRLAIARYVNGPPSLRELGEELSTSDNE